jgi:hypothetical protein
MQNSQSEIDSISLLIELLKSGKYEAGFMYKVESKLVGNRLDPSYTCVGSFPNMGHCSCYSCYTGYYPAFEK